MLIPRKFPAILCLTAAGVGLLLLSCHSETSIRQAAKTDQTPAARELDTTIGGRKVVLLTQPAPSATAQPQFLSAAVLPGRGMNVFQLRAYIPGKGEVDLLASPSLEEAAQQMNGGLDDLNGNKSFAGGGAILLPFANRIRGKLLRNGMLETTILGKAVKLVPNWKGKKPGAERHAMHGLILATPMDSVSTDADASDASVTGTLDAGNFGGHWLSKANVSIVETLKPGSFAFIVTVKNAGHEQMPVGIGWHPYFRILSGDRQQARLHIPATERVLVNNYDDVFPTGKVVPVAGTPYDFTAAEGAPLKQLYMDDCFVDFQKAADGSVTVEITDPAAHYGVRVKALSAQVSAFQVYAPPDKSFVVVEPQFNWGDPFSEVWKGRNTGMVILKPGESVSYNVEVQLFVPQS